MIGGRRCGKTSVLAVMTKLFDKEFGKSNLTIKPTSNTVTLNNKYIEMEELYAQKGKQQRFTPDDSPTISKNEYKIDISLKSKPNGKINFSFIDIPGEFFEKDEKSNEITELVSQSSVIIVAVDTPYLMEEAPTKDGSSVGQYNERRNRSRDICNFLKNLDLEKSAKMVIFVPLKAERYLHNGTMKLVNQRVHTAYQSFFEHINNDNLRDKCTAVIAPIFTFGTVEFTRFERNGADIIMDDYKTPKYPLYQFTDKARFSPEPKYCEQPLLYVLLYILKCAEMSKRKKYDNMVSRLFAVIGECLFQMPSAEDFLKETANIQKSVKISGDGYEIITDPLGLKGIM